MRRAGLYILMVATCSLAGCATTSYRDQVLNQPIPPTQADRDAECEVLRSEMARQRSIPAMATTPMMAAAFQAAARQNIAALETRAATLSCRAAFQTGPAPTRLPFSECMAKCRELTSRTSAECFDSCNK